MMSRWVHAGSDVTVKSDDNIEIVSLTSSEMGTVVRGGILTITVTTRWDVLLSTVVSALVSSPKDDVAFSLPRRGVKRGANLNATEIKPAVRASNMGMMLVHGMLVFWLLPGPTDMIGQLFRINISNIFAITTVRTRHADIVERDFESAFVRDDGWLTEANVIVPLLDHLRFEPLLVSRGDADIVPLRLREPVKEWLNESVAELLAL